MTRGAADCSAVVRIRGRQVSVGDRRPGGGAMAGIARQIRDKVPLPFSVGCRAVMATGARSRLVRVVHARDVEGNRALVTGIARCSGRDMSWRLAGRDAAVVTCRARRHNRGMGEPRTAKGRRTLVASLAGSSRRNVPRRLAGRRSTVVACRARRYRRRMIEPSSAEGHGTLVAGLTGRIGHDVSRRLADRIPAVVA
jgi:hypothetical protein